RPPAIFSIFNPAATLGDCPWVQPTPRGTCIGGSRKSCADGSDGESPDCCEGSRDALPPQPQRTASTASVNVLRTEMFLMDAPPWRCGRSTGEARCRPKARGRWEP